MTLEHPRQVSGELAETEKMIFVKEEMMQEEVKEAEAAVDVCYRRRARRAGLGSMLPTGRLMTEGELDALSEQLVEGSEPGLGGERRWSGCPWPRWRPSSEGSRRRSGEGGMWGQGGCP
jgi:hypothetical protein